MENKKKLLNNSKNKLNEKSKQTKNEEVVVTEELVDEIYDKYITCMEILRKN